jgi:hypothetical protein
MARTVTRRSTASVPIPMNWETEFVDIMAEILQGQYEIKVGGWRSPRRQVDYGCQYAHPAHEAKEL